MLPQFDKTFVLTLPRRKDRLDGFYALVDERIAAGDWPFERPETRYGADGRCVPLPHWVGDGVSAGGWGCSMAYARIIEDALSHGWESVMMFEDDACFREPGFAAAVEAAFAAVPDDWDVFYIGGNLREPRAHSPYVINDLIMRPYRMTATHGFAMRPRFMRAAYERIYRIPVRICDWRFADVHAEGWPFPAINCYSTIERLVGQRPNASDISCNQLNNPDHPKGYYFWPNPTTIRYLPDFRHPPPPECPWLTVNAPDTTTEVTACV